MGRPKKVVENPLQAIIDKQAAAIEVAKNELRKYEETVTELRDETKNFRSQTARVLHMTEFHMRNVEQETGEILMADVTYCINLSDRILFNEKED
jgi:hypothetical protein